MAAGGALFDPADVQDGRFELNLIPTQVNELGSPQPVPVGQQNHHTVPVTPSVSLGRGYQPLDLGLCEVLAGPHGAVGWSFRPDCSIYSRWRDKFEVRVDHAFGAFPMLTVRTRALYEQPCSDGRLLRRLLQAILQWTKLGRAVRIISKPRLLCDALPIRWPTSR